MISSLNCTDSCVLYISLLLIQNSGSKNVNLDRLKRESSRKRPYGAIGIEALVALRKIGIEPQYFYGVAEAAIEAAHSGLPFLIICTEDAIPELIKRLGDERLVPDFFDLSLYSENQ
jgi:putative transcriptional regulator